MKKRLMKLIPFVFIGLLTIVCVTLFVNNRLVHQDLKQTEEQIDDLEKDVDTLSEELEVSISELASLNSAYATTVLEAKWAKEELTNFKKNNNDNATNIESLDLELEMLKSVAEGYQVGFETVMDYMLNEYIGEAIAVQDNFIDVWYSEENSYIAFEEDFMLAGWTDSDYFWEDHYYVLYADEEEKSMIIYVNESLSEGDYETTYKDRIDKIIMNSPDEMTYIAFYNTDMEVVSYWHKED